MGSKKVVIVSIVGLVLMFIAGTYMYKSNQLEKIASGKSDWMTLFLYMNRAQSEDKEQWSPSDGRKTKKPWTPETKKKLKKWPY